MIDTKELRRLAQDATPGPWYVTGKLTRYVEARIDGGLIQEVAACGPTKADGGYGPQQEANARLIAAANPAAISELLDRLEAAEKERDILRDKLAVESQENGALRDSVDRACEERDALRNEIAYVKEVEFPRKAQAVADAWKGKCKRLEVERDALRAKIAAMEQQEPECEVVGQVHNVLYEVRTLKYDLPAGTKLYALPGAKGEEK